MLTVHFGLVRIFCSIARVVRLERLTLSGFFKVAPSLCTTPYKALSHLPLRKMGRQHLTHLFFRYVWYFLWWYRPLWWTDHYFTSFSLPFPLPGAKAALGIEILLLTVLLLAASLLSGLYKAAPLPRAQRRHPAWNIFIKGLTPKVVLLRTSLLMLRARPYTHTWSTDVPPGSSTAWIERELERRHLVPRRRTGKRLSYTFLFSPGDGEAARSLHAYQDLEAAGVCNNASIDVRFAVLGGVRNAEGMSESRVRVICCTNSNSWSFRYTGALVHL